MKAQDLFEKVTDDLIDSDRSRRIGMADAVAVSRWRHTDRASTGGRTVGGTRWCWRWSPPIEDGRRTGGPPTGRGSVTAARCAAANEAHAVVLWKPTERPRADESDEKAQSSRSLFARVFTVFAAEQVDGSDRFVPQPAEVDSEARVADAEPTSRRSAHAW